MLQYANKASNIMVWRLIIWLSKKNMN